MNFRCPYCDHDTTIVSSNVFKFWKKFDLKTPDKGDIGLNMLGITCPNPKCKKLYLEVSLTDAQNSWEHTRVYKTWNLLPESEAKVLPDYIPGSIQADYYEACRIRDLSPKASATLSRRCLQGMIRDFWKISKSRLKDEIDALEEKIDPLTWEAIDAVRQVGNIGAHMEKDINLIIDVEPDEAQLLIELIEQLVDDWYVEKHHKEQRLRKMKALAEEKKK